MNVASSRPQLRRPPSKRQLKDQRRHDAEPVPPVPSSYRSTSTHTSEASASSHGQGVRHTRHDSSCKHERSEEIASFNQTSQGRSYREPEFSHSSSRTPPRNMASTAYSSDDESADDTRHQSHSTYSSSKTRAAVTSHGNSRAMTPPPKPDTQYNEFAAAGVHSFEDQDLLKLFSFKQEIGWGNWGSVWKAQPRAYPADMDGIGCASASAGGDGAGGLIAIKLVHRTQEPATVVQRVRALWGEMKIVRSLRREPHPNIIQFEAFLITPGFAAIVMPCLSHHIPVPLDLPTARLYFRRLISGLGYLHERGITHNDIKPTNIMVSHQDQPVLVDFGFATKYDINDRARFLSTEKWGTPEYLDPLRAAARPHDERASDVWSLGITFFEVLVGRTPFENDGESFENEEQLEVYRKRTELGQWLGEWDFPEDVEELLRWMLYPDAQHRMHCAQAYYHRAFRPKLDAMDTPPFVREAKTEQFADADYSRLAEKAPQPPRQMAEPSRLEKKDNIRRLKTVKSDIGMRRKKDDDKHARAITPALGESIKQVNGVSRLRPKTPVRPDEQENVFTADAYKKGEIIKVIRTIPQSQSQPHALNESPRPTSRVYKQISEDKQPRVSPSEARPASGSLHHSKSLRRTNQTVSRVASVQSVQRVPSPTRMSASPRRSREEALKHTMRSLEGMRGTPKRSVSPIKLEHTRPATIDFAQELSKHELQRRSEVVQKRTVALEDVAETEEVLAPRQHISPPTTPSAVPVRRTAKPPMLDVDISTSTVFRPSIADQSFSGRKRVQSTELELISRYRSGELPKRQELAPSPARKAKQSTAPSAIDDGPNHALDGLDRLANWAKVVERYVVEARAALEEGRPAPELPCMPDDLEQLGIRPITPSADQLLAPPVSAGMSDSSRGTSSTLVEHPRVGRHHHQAASVDAKPQGLKRQTVSQVFKRFVDHRVISAEPSLGKRKSDSNLMDSFGLSRPTHVPLASEDNYKGYAEDDIEELAPMSQTLPTRAVHKQTSSVSLRERARAFLSPVEKNATLPRHTRFHTTGRATITRPDTPAAASTLSSAKGERKSIFKIFRKKAT